MRRIILLVTVAVVIAVMMAASALPVFAQGNGARVTECSQPFGPEVAGVIVFAPDGTPSLFTCQEEFSGS